MTANQLPQVPFGPTNLHVTPVCVGCAPLEKGLDPHQLRRLLPTNKRGDFVERVEVVRC